MPSNEPFFIVGCGRSGTTLLRLILSGHSRIHIGPETWFIEPLVRQFSLTDTLTSAQVESVIDIVTSHYRWPDMEIAAENFRASATALAAPKLFELVNLIYRRQLENASKIRAGDKTPPYIRIVPELAALYPAAKFIHLIRDGRDVAISYVHANWNRYHDRKDFAWTLAMERRRVYLGLPVSRRILEIKYEDLIGDLEPTVHKICAFLGEAYEPAMLDWQKSTAQIPERERHIHPKLNQPLSDNSVAMWKTRLSPLECFLIEACLHKDLLELGYELRFSSAAWRPALRLSGLLLHGLSPLLQRGIPYLQRRNYLPKTIYI